MNILRFDILFIMFSVVVIGACLGALAVFGLNMGIDFTGGSILEIEYVQGERPSNQEIQGKLSDLDIEGLSIQPSGEKGVLMRMKNIPQEKHREILARLGQEVQEERFESIGPVIGRELQQKALIMIILSLLGITVYIALAFRRVVRPIKSWHLSIIGLVTLSHDVIVPLGILAVLGKFYGIQISTPIVAALLTIVGFSINDTVVIFDRIRENLLRRVGIDFRDTANKSLTQTFTRSINTSLTVLISLLAILFWGGDTLRDFALTLTIGVVAGLYSSLFLAPAMLVKWVEKNST